MQKEHLAIGNTFFLINILDQLVTEVNEDRNEAERPLSFLGISTKAPREEIHTNSCVT